MLDFDFVPRFGQQFCNRVVQFIAPDVLVANHSIGIDHERTGPSANIPFDRDRASSPILTGPKTSPVDTLLLHVLAGGFYVLITVDSQKHERFVCQLFNERPLVWVLSPACSSPDAPKVNDSDFTFVIAQLEINSIEIAADHIGRRFSDF